VTSTVNLDKPPLFSRTVYTIRRIPQAFTISSLFDATMSSRRRQLLCINNIDTFAYGIGEEIAFSYIRQHCCSFPCSGLSLFIRYERSTDMVVRVDDGPLSSMIRFGESPEIASDFLPTTRTVHRLRRLLNQRPYYASPTKNKSRIHGRLFY
jgi:hypothetical protein